MGSIYNPDGSHSHDATCWPLAATDAELTGLPPHIISVNELDPLRDEGLLYYRRLGARRCSRGRPSRRRHLPWW